MSGITTNRPAIIAMQGDPFTGKTTIASYLAGRLQWSTVRFHDILDVISCGEPHPPPPQKASALISQAYDLIAQIVKTQISLGLSIVVDCPLSRRSHLDKLVDLFTFFREKDVNLSLLLIECKPQTRFSWEMLFNNRDSSSYGKWYNPSSWPFDPQFTRDYMDDDRNIHPLVSKLVVNTTNHVALRLVLAAVHDLLSCTEAHYIEFDKWRPIQPFPDDTKKGNNSEFCHDGHFISIYMEDRISGHHVDPCRVCSKSLANSGSVYTCGFCPLAIHKCCAELPGGNKVFTPDNFPTFFKREPNPTYCFPQEHLCHRCKAKGVEYQFSYECESCIFETHLKCKLIPTILHHHTHEHWLTFKAKSILKKDSYLCAACWRRGELFGYRCKKKYCYVYYHPECAFLPPLVREHQHCGYTHDLKMIYEREKELEDYICHLCFERMSPQAWYYYCEYCILSLHLDCAFKEFI